MLNSIKAGDKVRKANGNKFSNGSYVVTVEKISSNRAFLRETTTNIAIEHLVLDADMVHQPNHYTQGGIETFDILKAKLTPAGYEGYLAGNILKYITRYEHKNGLEDLQKASVYLAKLIEVKQGV